MLEFSAIALTYLAFSAWHAARPERLPDDLRRLPHRWNITLSQWRRLAHLVGWALVVVAGLLAVTGSDPLVGLITVATGVMTSGVIIVLGSPVAPQWVWVGTATCAAITPILILGSLTTGGALG
jgi:hypothetical protein